MSEDINIDMGGNDDELSVINSMCTTVVGEQLMDYTHSPVQTTITATNQSNGEFTPVRSGSTNWQSILDRRNTKQLPITAIRHYRQLQQQRRGTTTTTPFTHLQKTDMIRTISRGNHENRVGSVQGRQEDQE
jgi:hypothetical protein